jgi:LacI family transcriptional regulator, purine nucleotide synthesis repressor
LANIKQIAKEAGVSITTVSRVLNHHPYVSEAKRKAVLEAVERLNYSRNINAIHLIKGRTNLIGVILPFINHPYFAMVMEGIGHEALQAEKQLILHQTDYRPAEEQKILTMLKMKQIDGVIICSKNLDWKKIESYTQYGPIVACDNTGEHAISSVYIDHYTVFQQGLNYLISKGHHQIGFCLSRPNSDSSQRRKSAYFDVLSSIHEPIREEWMFYNCYSIEDGVKVVQQLLKLKERPTALLVTGDQVAAGIIMEAEKQGLAVPDDLAVIGFDNQPIAKVLGITTIDNQLFQMGSTAFRILCDQLNGKANKPIKQEMEFKLIQRSTA